MIERPFLTLPAFARNIEVSLNADTLALAVDLPVSRTALLYAVFSNEILVFLAGVIANGDVAVSGAGSAAVARVYVLRFLADYGLAFAAFAWTGAKWALGHTSIIEQKVSPPTKSALIDG